MICLACNNTKSRDVEQPLDGDTLEMFNFVCCLDISQPEESQGICSFCIEELKVSFNFKKRCLEIFANVFDNPNHHHEKDQNEEDDGMDFMNSILDQSLHEEDASINLNDLLIPEVCMGSTALTALDITDQSKCRYCFKEFSSKEECQEHLEEHKGDDKPYKCPHEGCESRFKARKNLKDHYLVHSNERPFPCHFCNQTFKSSSNRSKHERRIHTKERNAMKAAEAQEGLKKLEVKIGNVLQKQQIVPANNALVRNVQDSSTKFKEKDPLETRAVFVSEDDRVYACDQEGCTRSFRTRSSLRDHQKVHSEERPYQCNFCSSAFKSSSNRSKHERSSHSVQFQKRKMEREAEKFNKDSSTTNDEVVSKKMKIEPAPVESIMIQSQNSSFNSSSSPSTTQNSTQKRTNFPCRYCDRLFKQTDSRDKHEATHKDFFAYDCGYCNKKFKSQELLKEHMKIHIESSVIKCSFPNCNEVFQDRRSMREHKNQHEPEEFICELESCGKIFYSSKALRNHKKHAKHYVSTNDSNDNQEADIIECEICEVKFNSDKIAEHLRLHI